MLYSVFDLLEKTTNDNDNDNDNDNENENENEIKLFFVGFLLRPKDN
jgi:hypothetical protein